MSSKPFTTRPMWAPDLLVLLTLLTFVFDASALGKAEAFSLRGIPNFRNIKELWTTRPMWAPDLLDLLDFLGVIFKKFIICNHVLTLIPFLPRGIGVSVHRWTALREGIEGI